MINWMVNAGDVTGNLVQQGIKNGDIIMIKLFVDPKSREITQDDINTILKTYEQTLSVQNLNVSVVVVPLPINADITVTTLDEKEKEKLREQMRKLGVI